MRSSAVFHRPLRGFSKHGGKAQVSWESGMQDWAMSNLWRLLWSRQVRILFRCCCSSWSLQPSLRRIPPDSRWFRLG